MSAQPEPMPHLARIAARPVPGEELVTSRGVWYRVVEVRDDGEPVVRRVEVDPT